MGKGENAGDQHFLLFPRIFSKVLSFRIVKSQDWCGKGLALLSNDKIWDLTKLKAHADVNIHVIQKLKFALGMVENIVG